MTDVGIRPECEVGHRRVCHRTSWCAGVVALAILLPFGDWQPGSSGRAAPSERTAQADGGSRTSRDSWFRIGHFLNDMRRNVREDHPDRMPEAEEPRPQHVVTPFDTAVPAVRGRKR